MRKELEKIDICTCITDSLCCTPETNTVSQLSPIKNSFDKILF